MFGYKPSVTINKTTKIVDGVITAEKTDFLRPSSTNLFNMFDCLSDFALDTATGEPKSSPGHVLSGFIKIKPSTQYTDNLVLRYAFYDANKKFISAPSGAPNPSTVTSPSTAEYMRVVCNKSDLGKNIRINEGPILLDHEEYSINIGGLRVVNTHQVTAEELRSAFVFDDKYNINGTLDGIYTAPTIPDKLDMSTMVYTDIITLYDALVTAYPNYVTKTELGLDSSGNTIYRYDFKAPSVPLTSIQVDRVKKPKIILVSGVHGSEKAGVYNLYQTMNQICNNWSNNDLLETLRWEVDFIVVPVVNVYGFDNNTRKNANGVDLARNFTTRWSLGSDPLAETYGGPTPLSELEAQYVDAIMSENKDAVLFASCHNFTTPTSNEYFIWGCAATVLQTQIVKSLISKLSRKWKATYAWLPQDDTTYFGYAGYSAPPGSEGVQAASYGIQGGTFEVCSAFFLEPGYARYDSIALTLGLETTVNYLISALKSSINYYNTNARIS